jgi:eukaryotic-like serine/threonine-protein kinase
MPFDPGTRFGPYEILGPLGAGGMGEVYRARDTRLDRIVAFKILAPDLANQPGHRERFSRETRAISSLSHPHICTSYDVGEQDDVSYLVMEYLEGETLAARLLRGPLPRDEVLQRATEIAAALDHAHRLGIIHRDLKPSNVMLTATGAKLLDFGLAKIQHLRFPSASATATMPGAATTVEGSIVGTVQYMAPEQLEGKDADARTDVFAFGALVYEMATGRKVFTGDSQASLIAAILRADAPRISALVPLIPASLDHVVMRCLEKSADDRWQTTRDLMLELREIARQGSEGHSRRITDDTRTMRERIAWALAIAATAVAVVASVLYVQAKRSQGTSGDAPATAAVRSEIPAPANTIVGAIALSPDGRRLVFVGRNGLTTRLWVRALDSVTATPLSGTEGADYPFWSPDGQSLGFFADGKLKRIELAGGPAQPLAEAPNTRGGTWGRNGMIVFSPNSQTLWRVPATGGQAEEITTLDASRGENSHRWPSFLPDGERFFYLAQGSVEENRGLFVGFLDKTPRKFIVRTEDSGVYAEPGYLLFLRDTRLLAQRFRTDSLRVEGTAVELATPVGVNGLERAQFDVSSGTLVYRRGTFLGGSELVWLNREGRRLGEIGSGGDFRAVRISPDGRYVAFAIEDQRVGTPDVWIHDVARNMATRFTFDPGTDRDPIWSPDGSRLAVRSNRNERFNIYARALNGVGGEQLLYNSSENANIHDWSRDGQFMIFTRVDPKGKTGRDIWMLRLDGNHGLYPLLEAPLNQDYPRFSRSGRLLSYQTDDSGRNKVFVVPYPPTGDKWEISPDGGAQPLWRADGGELFYVAPDNTIMGVEVRQGRTTVEFGTPRRLFQAAMAVLPARQPSWTWDVFPDGQRFLLILAKADDAPVTLMTNWQVGLNP